ncbi:hypothetical protein [Raineyella fluvialis]|uniref:PH domain-containing protein n=1 Tax=Raineyella fluvialis TaxID=2662261 RepID=A0A5Q2F7M2_9ACTN|nr:hypothetical protein [Raineyella fluvialis]QGF22922.1 hypothetical protein Rai3103_03725 [Raineyella fluvialis]
MNTYRLDAALPARAFGIAAGLLIVGGLLLVVATAAHWHVVVVVIAVVLVVLGALQGALAFLVASRGRVRISLTDSGYQLAALGRTSARDWTDITRATVTDDELRLYPRDDEERPDRVPVLDPGRRGDFERLAEEVTERMRAAYGRLD